MATELLAMIACARSFSFCQQLKLSSLSALLIQKKVNRQHLLLLRRNCPQKRLAAVTFKGVVSHENIILR